MKIYIDVGHGKVGEDSGASGTLTNGSKVYESTYVLDIAKSARSYLVEGKGHEVTLSRDSDVNLGGLVGKYGRADSNLINSANQCKSGDYDLMVSIHCNSSSNTNANGYLLIWKTGDGKSEQSEELANTLATALAKTSLARHDVKSSPQGKSGDYYGILRLHDKVGVLIETAFMSNAEDLAKLSKASLRASYGQAIGKGIDAYLQAKSAEINTAKIEKLEAAAEQEAEAPVDTTDYKAQLEALTEKYNQLLGDYDSLAEKHSNVKAQMTELLVNLDAIIAKYKI